jgi:hypothetical protein
MFPPCLEHDAFRTDNGELGWTRAQIPLVVSILRSQPVGILGGELWWVRDGMEGWNSCIPQRHVHQVYVPGIRIVGPGNHGKSLWNAVLPTRLPPWSGGRVLETCRMIYPEESFTTSPTFPSLRVKF